MWRKSLFVFLLFTFLFAGLAEARGFTSVPAFDMEQLKMNGEVIYNYNAPFLKFIDPDLDRVQSFFRKLAESLHAILIWDESHKTISIIKPEVQMITAAMVGKKDDSLVIAGPFSKVKKGEKLDRFFVYTEISNLPDEDLELRLLIETPGTKDKGTFTVNPGVIQNHGEDAWMSFQVNNAVFDQAGDYKIKLQIKIPSVGDSFYTIAEKTISTR